MSEGTSRALIVAVVGMAVASFFAYTNLSEGDFDPSVAIRFGERDQAAVDYGRELLGTLVVSPSGGHDGKFFFSQALDPFYLEPDVHAIYLDRPAYRAQRMLYPTIAGGFGFLSPRATAWGLIAVNIVAMGAGTFATSRVALHMGLSRWLGLAFTFNVAMIVELNIDGAGVIALGALMAAVWAVHEDELLWATMACAAALLARETMIIGVVGLAIYVLRYRGTKGWLLLGSGAAPLLWWFYLQIRLDDEITHDTQAIDIPFKGFVEAFQRWVGGGDHFVDLIVGFVLLLMSVVLLIRSLKMPTPVGWATMGFALLAPLLSEPVWFRYFDSTRALAPILTGYVVVLALAVRKPIEVPVG